LGLGPFWSFTIPCNGYFKGEGDFWGWGIKESRTIISSLMRFEDDFDDFHEFPKEIL
jgi:hypothetical protein